MKNINKKSIDPIYEARKNKHFGKYSLEAENKIRLAIEIYKKREELKISQQELAKAVQSTQKVISRIESADVNIGFHLLNRIAKVLNFDYKTWASILDFGLPIIDINFVGGEKEKSINVFNEEIINK